MKEVSELAAKAGAAVIACPSPLFPDTLEAVFLPEEGLAFVTGDCRGLECRRVHLDFMVCHDRAALRRARGLFGELMAQAQGHLQLAKAHHDRLEDLYKPYIDFPGLTRYTQETVAAVFGERN